MFLLPQGRIYPGIRDVSEIRSSPLRCLRTPRTRISDMPAFAVVVEPLHLHGIVVPALQPLNGFILQPPRELLSQTTSIGSEAVHINSQNDSPSAISVCCARARLQKTGPNENAPQENAPETRKLATRLQNRVFEDRLCGPERRNSPLRRELYKGETVFLSSSFIRDDRKEFSAFRTTGGERGGV